MSTCKRRLDFPRKTTDTLNRAGTIEREFQRTIHMMSGLIEKRDVPSIILRVPGESAGWHNTRKCSKVSGRRPRLRRIRLDEWAEKTLGEAGMRKTTGEDQTGACGHGGSSSNKIRRRPLLNGS